MAEQSPGVAEASMSTVAFKVTQDCWCNVRDNNDKELISSVLHAGNARVVNGEPPFKVIVGNVAALESIRFDGNPVDPTKYNETKEKIARFDLP